MSLGSQDSKAMSHVAFSGAVWLSAARWSLRLANLLGIILLARLLGPDDFGLVAGALVVIGLFNLIGSLGMQSAVVQRRGDLDTRFVNVAWTYDTVVMRVAASAAIFLSAPWLAVLFSSPGLEAITAALAVVPLLNVPENAAMLVLTRRMDYRRRFVLESSKAVATVAILIPLAFVLQSAWALVYATWAGAAARSLASYFVHPHLPRLRFDPDVVRELFPYSKWIFGQNALRIATAQLDKFLLGALLGAIALGVYQIGARLGNLIFGDLHHTAAKVMFPIYAHVQDDAARVHRTFILAFEFTATVAFAAGAMLAIAAPPIIRVIFGQQWLGAVPVMQILVVALALRATLAVAHPMFRGMGRPGIEFGLLLMQAALQIVLLWAWAPRFGVVGAAWAILVAEVLWVPLWLFALHRGMGIPPSRPMGRALWALLGAAVTAVGAAGGAFWTTDQDAWIRLLATLGAGGVAGLAFITAASWAAALPSVRLIGTALRRRRLNRPEAVR